MTCAPLPRIAALAIALFACTAPPVLADRWDHPRIVQPFAPVGVAPAPDALPFWQDRHPRANGWPRPHEPRGQGVELRHPRYLPLRCAESHRVGTGRLHVFGARCLRHRGVDLHALPHRCAVTLRTARDVLRGFEATCLREAGYRMAGD